MDISFFRPSFPTLLASSSPQDRDRAGLYAEKLSIDEARDNSLALSRAPVRYFNGRNLTATVAFLDGFEPGYGDCDESSHGEKVVARFRQSCPLPDSEIQKIDTGNCLSLSAARLLSLPGEESPAQRVAAGIEIRLVEHLRRTNEILESMLANPHLPLTTINQSEGTSAFLVMTGILKGALGEDMLGRVCFSPKGEYLCQALGVPATFQDGGYLTMLRALAEKIAQVRDRSPSLILERRRHEELSRRLGEAGISYVVSAGNDHDVMAPLLENHVVPPDFENNLLSNPYNIVVGALDDRGTPTPTDDTVADFSSRDPEVDFLAPGVKVPLRVGPFVGEVCGTSFSAPYVAGQLALLHREHPDAPADEIKEILILQSGVGVRDCDIPVIY